MCYTIRRPGRYEDSDDYSLEEGDGPVHKKKKTATTKEPLPVFRPNTQSGSSSSSQSGSSSSTQSRSSSSTQSRSSSSNQSRSSSSNQSRSNSSTQSRSSSSTQSMMSPSHSTSMMSSLSTFVTSPSRSTSTLSVADPSTAPWTASKERDGQLFRLLLEIKQQVRQNTTLLQALQNQRQAEGAVRGAALDMLEEDTLPLHTLADLQELCRKLKDKPFRKQLIQHLATIGGSTEKDVVVNIMAKIFVKQLAVQLNWKGRGKKQSLEAFSELVQVIIRATHRSWSSSTNVSVQNYIKDWLRYASDREGGRKAREEKKKDEEKQNALAKSNDSDDASSEGDDESEPEPGTEGSD